MMIESGVGDGVMKWKWLWRDIEDKGVGLWKDCLWNEVRER